MEEDKIQSSKGSLKLELQQVPKMLGILNVDWAPDSFVTSFKLETNERILQDKANGALEKYKHNLVIANLLQTRKDVCWLVERVKLL